METLLKASVYILGATGSSIVYKAVLADGTALAVRRIGESGGVDKRKDFEAQVRSVAWFRHPNILRLRGFYWGAEEKLIIHDYATNGGLANIGVNLSQFICIGRFSAVSFQVLGHMKTVLVLFLGFLFFGKEGLNFQVVLGMILAVLGMIWYGNASAKPGGTERRSILPVRSDRHNGASEEKDGGEK